MNILLLSVACIWSASYVVYPHALRRIYAQRQRGFGNRGERASALSPGISILIVAHNEELSIAECLRSVMRAAAPLREMEVQVGSDASTDATDTIVEHISRSDARVKLVRVGRRSGKAVILNELAASARCEILVLLDADVVLHVGALASLQARFGDHRVGVVAANLLPTSAFLSERQKEVEREYAEWECSTKFLGGELWGCAMGAHGGCMAVRREAFRSIPADVINDDFFLTMSE